MEGKGKLFLKAENQSMSVEGTVESLFGKDHSNTSFRHELSKVAKTRGKTNDKRDTNLVSMYLSIT